VVEAVRPLRVGYVVAALGRGGAELQLLQLAAGMVRRDHHVSVIAYGGPSVLDDEFRAAGVEVVAERAVTRMQKRRVVRAWMMRSQFDVIHAILQRASSVSLLARWPRRKPAIIATDYSTASFGPRTSELWMSLMTFVLADRVVTEVEVNRRSLERLVPPLRGRTLVIRNGLDTETFRPASVVPRGPVFVFCAVGTLYDIKNPLRVIEAIDEMRRRGRTGFRLDWYGRDSPGDRQNVGHRARLLVRERGLQDYITFHGETQPILEAYQRADALIHASLQEGFPNVVAEAMACGLPLLVSRVSDLPAVVKEARNGLVFDETSATAIADAMEQMMDRSIDERMEMGLRSRKLAIAWFRLDRFLEDFERLYRSLT
jgi:glycosyltransferase involved in cell wall biosynthesis